MAKKKSNSRVIAHGVDYINIPQENANNQLNNSYAQQTTTTYTNTANPNQVAANQYQAPDYKAPTVSNTPTTTAQQPTTQTTRTYQSTFKPTDLTNHYKNEMLDTDDDRPDAYESAYESTINEILDTIKNRGSFDVKNDANYNALYDQYAERYKAQAQRAMNDAMASANAATGGYGSTYGAAVGQQAYDNTMQGMNDNNMQLLNLAYDIYQGDRANDYNMLNAYRDVDNTMYGRYRDDVADWQTDREYNANQYWNSFTNDRSAYDTDRAFDYGMDQDEINRDDANYQDALSQAMALAKDGLPVPSYITDRINQYNQKYGLSGDAQATLAQLAAQALADTSSSGGGGRRGRKSGSSPKKDTTDKTDNTPSVVKHNDVVSLYNQLDKLNSGTVADRLSTEALMDDIKANNYIDFTPSLQPIHEDLARKTLDNLNSIALNNALKKSKNKKK